MEVAGGIGPLKHQKIGRHGQGDWQNGSGQSISLRQDKVAIVSHYGFFNHLVWALIGFERPQGSWFVLNNTSVSRFELTDTTVNMVYINRVDHLRSELITE